MKLSITHELYGHTFGLTFLYLVLCELVAIGFVLFFLHSAQSLQSIGHSFIDPSLHSEVH